MARGIKQTKLDASGSPTGEVQYVTESVAGSGIFDQILAAAPANRTAARFEQRPSRVYNFPTTAGKVNWSVLPAGTYFSARFKWGMNFNPGLAIADLKLRGWNWFPRPAIIASDLATSATTFGVAPADAFIMYSEQAVLLDNSGFRYQDFIVKDLDKVAAYFFNSVSIDGRAKFWTCNIEQSGFFNPGDNPTWWTANKGRSIKKETDGTTVTLEQLNNSGQWASEMMLRLANRYGLLAAYVRYQSPGILFAIGTANQFGEVFAGDESALPGYPSSSGVNIRGFTGGGDVLTVQTNSGQRSLTIPPVASIFALEDYELDYDYPAYAKVYDSDYTDIFINKRSGTQTAAYLYSKLIPGPIVAMLKARWQVIRARMRVYYGNNKTVPIIHMNEIGYEADQLVVANSDGSYNRLASSWLPWTLTDGKESRKPFISPGHHYSTVIVTRFLNANLPESGNMLFDGGNFLWHNPIGANGQDMSVYRDAETHVYDAIHQARVDMQGLERFLDNSTLVENPEVQIGATGSFSAYVGREATGILPEGGHQATKPAYLLRYLTSNSVTTVVIIGSYDIAIGATHSDVVRLPGSGLNGATFLITLKGPFAQMFTFTLPAGGEAQQYVAGAQSALPNEKSGYTGRIAFSDDTAVVSTTGIVTSWEMDGDYQPTTN